MFKIVFVINEMKNLIFSKKNQLKFKREKSQNLDFIKIFDKRHNIKR